MRKSLIFLCFLGFLSAPVAGQPVPTGVGDRFLVLDLRAAKPGAYPILVIVKEDGAVSWERLTVVEVGGGGVSTPPPPPPPPLTGLAAKAVDWAKLAGSGPEWQAEAIKLAAAYESVAERIDSGALANALDIPREQLRANVAAIGETARTRWVETVNQFADFLTAELQAGRIRAVKDHATLWRQFAAGLRRAAQ